MKILDKLTHMLFAKRIEAIAKKQLKELALDKYINENLDISNVGKGEIRFLGHKFIKLLAWSFADILEDAENYVSIDVTSEGKNINVILQKTGKMTPHQKAEMYKKKYEDLVEKIGHT